MQNSLCISRDLPIFICSLASVFIMVVAWRVLAMVGAFRWIMLGDTIIFTLLLIISLQLFMGGWKELEKLNKYISQNCWWNSGCKTKKNVQTLTVCITTFSKTVYVKSMHGGNKTEQLDYRWNTPNPNRWKRGKAPALRKRGWDSSL